MSLGSRSSGKEAGHAITIWAIGFYPYSTRPQVYDIV